ncbi:pseudouridine synthase [Helicobacter cappadocius]|uniref:Pseudouridine synthase n=1 Tax=Helicobacter cappadocius TaxID=3063998 RepID=A0AA90SSH7_9HELI|nr:MULTISPECIES: pseudouridine synthase [unclassified Helicobacter]MDO7252836.1 pseudouridine synthase [Helicobacter sp. faydin-H75]MDP2538879.1 pseudouridine synthase [Helicobacter sp. faydin-H76]
MRLNQFISHNAKYSRREADILIEQGRVNIEKTKANTKSVLLEGQRVFIDGKYIKPKQEDNYTVIVYHKPKGELVSKKDDRGRRVIYDAIGSKYAHFAPIGRLDFASEGVLLLSDNKKIVQCLMQSDLEREYIVKINGKITEEMIKAMNEGIHIEDASSGAHQKSRIQAMTFAPFVKYDIGKNDAHFSKLKVTITEGKNRELRRFFAYFNADVMDLRRIRYGWVNLNALPVGKVRFLSKDEYKKLHHFISGTEKTDLNISKKNI